MSDSKNSTNKNMDLEKLPFEEALQELETIVSRLETGSVPLAESLKIYERGEALKRHCEKLLQSAELRIEKIQLSREEKPEGTTPFDAPEG